MAGKTHRIGPSLIDTAKVFATEENCHLYLESARWPEGVRCLKCDHNKISKFTVKGVKREYADGAVKPTPDRFMYQCLNPKCKYQFAATTGTIFSDTHLPLSKWMLAVALMCNAKKGISAKQMERDLGVSYKTAWYLCHRIRKSMEEGAPGLLTGTVEADETYVGGRYDRRRKRGPHENSLLLGFLNAAPMDSRPAFGPSQSARTPQRF
jgi:transposase-like protein